jgi:hypothetical protein
MTMPMPPGENCFCNAAAGPIAGVVQDRNQNPASMENEARELPHYCCTPQGRIGPLENNGVRVGGFCSVNLRGYVVGGQACY